MIMLRQVLLLLLLYGRLHGLNSRWRLQRLLPLHLRLHLRLRWQQRRFPGLW